MPKQVSERDKLLRIKSMNARFDEYNEHYIEKLLDEIANAVPSKVIPLMDELIEYYVDKKLTPRTIQNQLSDVYAPGAPRKKINKILSAAQSASAKGSAVVGRVTAGIIAIILTAGSTVLNSYIFNTAIHFILTGSNYLTSVSISAIINSIISSVAALPAVVYNNPYISGVLSFLFILSYFHNEKFFKHLGTRAAATFARNTAMSSESEQKARADIVYNWITARLSKQVSEFSWKGLLPFFSGMNLEDIQKLRADIKDGEGYTTKFFEGHYHEGPSATGTILKNQTEFIEMVKEFISDLNKALKYLEQIAASTTELVDKLQGYGDSSDSGDEVDKDDDVGGGSSRRRKKSSRKPRNKRKTIRKKVSKTRKRTLNKKSKKRSKKLRR